MRNSSSEGSEPKYAPIKLDGGGYFTRDYKTFIAGGSDGEGPDWEIHRDETGYVLVTHPGCNLRDLARRISEDEAFRVAITRTLGKELARPIMARLRAGKRAKCGGRQIRRAVGSSRI